MNDGPVTGDVWEVLERLRKDKNFADKEREGLDLGWIAAQVAKAPPLTDEQRAALIPLLRRTVRGEGS